MLWVGPKKAKKKRTTTLQPSHSSFHISHADSEGDFPLGCERNLCTSNPFKDIDTSSPGENMYTKHYESAFPKDIHPSLSYPLIEILNAMP